MAGLESDRQSIINTAPIAAIGTGSGVTPGVADFMQAFRQGFLTVDDITRRALDVPVDASNRKLQLSANDLKARQIQAQTELQPAALDLARRQQIQAGEELKIAEAGNAAELAMAQKKAARIAKLADPRTFAEGINEEVDESSDVAFAALLGNLPEFFELNKPAKAVDFPEWYHEAKIRPLMDEAAKFQSGFPPNSPEDNKARAAFFTARAEAVDKKAAGDEYLQYYRDQQNSKARVVRGTPEYRAERQKRFAEAQTKAGVNAAGMKSLENLFVLQAKAQAEAPEKIQAAKQTLVAELSKEVVANPAIRAFKELSAAAGNVKRLAAITSPTNRSDLALIYANIKALDPGSVVREGEIVLSGQADPVIAKAVKKINGLFSRGGKLLNDADRADLLRVAAEIEAGAQASVRPELERYALRAQRGGVMLDEVLNDADRAVFSGVISPAATSTQPRSGVPTDADVGKKFRAADGRLFTVEKAADGKFVQRFY